MDLYQINEGRLTLMSKANVFQDGLKEMADLESWIRDADRIFDRERVLWISRQERTASDERADLIGIDRNELLVVELKRGTVTKEAISQALSYLSNIGKRNRQELVELFVEQAAKTGKSALLATPLTREDAEARFADHEPREGSVNEAHRIILVGTDFLPETLQTCGYLNEQLTGGILILECWQMHIYQNGSGYLCAFDKLMPSRDVEEEIEARREHIRATSYKRDQRRIAVMYHFKDLTASIGKRARSSQGQSYEGYVEAPDGHRIYLDIYNDPKLWVQIGGTSIDHAAMLKEIGATKETDKGQDYVVVPLVISDWESASEQKALAKQAFDLVNKALTPAPETV